ncbi:hypothetical protein [Streptomyces boninensis]|uniref:hypothetical protein n=1 Tax=Streptomyces boninensis TaxID=2039455 RepID=UPI003B21A690
MRAAVPALALGALLAGGLPASAHDDIPDPAPHGPQRPYEDQVDGPRNADGLSAAISAVPEVRGGVRVRFERTSAAASGPEERPAPVRRFVIMFDKSVRLNTWAFPACDLEALRADGPSACPEASRIGGGEYVPWTPPSRPPSDSAEVFVFNGRSAGRPALYVWTAGTTLVQTVENVVGGYRKHLGTGLDEILPVSATPPLERAVSAKFVLDFGATTTVHGRPVSFLSTTPRPQKPYRFGYWTEFVTGQRQLTTAGAHLTGGAR